MGVFRRVILCIALVSGCGTGAPRTESAMSPLVYDGAEVARARTLAILVPGALASVDIFAPAAAWERSGYALIRYRFPGMDGLPQDHALKIDAAADEIARFANRHPGKRIRLLGYSTGGPIALLAASRIRAADVKVAAMSTAVERAGGAATALRVTGDILAAAVRAGTVGREAVWLEYYRTLLFGRAGLRDPARQAEIERLVAQERDRIVVPDDGLASAHSDDLKRWRLPAGFHLDPARTGIFVGGADPVFSTAQTRRFAAAIGAKRITAYPGQGHLLFLTEPRVFDDIFRFFED